MKKVLILSCICLSTSLVHGQILKSDGSYINPIGTLGYCKPDGTVQDKTHTTIGYIKTDGTVQDQAHTTIGYVKTDGTMEDGHHVAIGYYMPGGDLQDASHRLIGHLNTQQEATLRTYFFH